MGEMPVQAPVGYAWRIYHQLRSDLLEDQKRMQNQVTPKDGPGKSERTARWEVFQGVSYTNKQLTNLDKLTPYVDFDKRRSELKTLGIPEINEGAYRKIIYTKYQLAKHLEYLEKKLWQDGSFASRRLFATVRFCAFTGARR